MRINPYSRLLKRVKDWCWKVTHRKQIGMWSYPTESLDKGWKLNDLYERIKAADQLGYNVILKATDKGLEVYYREKAPDIPWDWK